MNLGSDFPTKTRFALVVLGLFTLFGPSAHAALITYYDFDGGSLTDTVGGVVATDVGGGSTTAGFSGDAWSFDGTNFLRPGVNLRPDAMPQMTWGAWVNASSSTPVDQVLSMDDAAPGDFDRSIGIDFRGGGGTGWSAFRGPTGTGVVGSGSRPVTLGSWTFVAASYDENINEMRFYVDGEPVIVASTAFTGGQTFFDIGHNPSFGEFFHGAIDEVFVFDEVLSAAQIDNIRLNGVAAVHAPGGLALFIGALALLGFAKRPSLALARRSE